MYQTLTIPVPSSGLQINFCKNPYCKNFGVTPQTEDLLNNYELITDENRGGVLRCSLCKTIAILKSNEGVQDEYKRLDFLPSVAPSLCCPTVDCENSSKSVEESPNLYHKFGVTAYGKPRFRCKICKKTFTKKSHRRQHRRPETNVRIFLALVNRLPFNRICEMENIRSKTLYDKLDFIYECCRIFARNQEEQLKNTERSVFLSVDTKNFYLNWKKSSHRKNVCLQTVSTVEVSSGYVLGCHSNIDLSVSLNKLEKEIALEKSCCQKKEETDSISKYLLSNDYGQNTDLSDNLIECTYQGLLGDVEVKYNELIHRKDFGVEEVFNKHTSPPNEGIQVRFDYTLYGHFYWLKQILPKNSRKAFYLAYDSSLREACLSIFKDSVRKKTSELFYIRSEKNLSVTQRRKKVKNSSNPFREYQNKHKGMSVREAELSLIKERMKEMAVIGHWKDHWLTHPISHMGEPGKVVSHLTNTGNLSDEILSEYYLDASLFPVKRFYDRLQNRVSVLSEDTTELPTAKWNTYGAYKPSVLIKLIEIFRIYHNYILTDRYGETPAQRIGLSKKTYLG